MGSCSSSDSSVVIYLYFLRVSTPINTPTGRSATRSLLLASTISMRYSVSMMQFWLSAISSMCTMASKNESFE